MKKILLLLVVSLTINLNAQIAESFEGETFPPEGWAAFAGTSGSSAAEWEQQDDIWTGHYGFAHTGDFATISSFDWEGLTEGWLVTPQFTPTAEEHTLYFFQRQLSSVNYYSEYTVRVSTASQDTHADFTTIDTQSEADMGLVYTQHSVDLSAYIDTPIYIAFVHAQDDDDEWYIDDVLTEAITLPGASTNPSPADGSTDIMITNSQTSHIPFSWEAPTSGGDILQYDFSIGSSAEELSLLGHPTAFEANPSIFHFGTTYYWTAAATNMMGETSPTWSFTTAAQPTVSAPYTIDFENEGFVPDACDQFITNEKWWEYTNEASGHIGNDGDFEGTTTESGGYFAYIDDSTSSNALNTTFTTPYIDFSGIADPAVSFYINSNNEGGANVNFSVKIRPLGGEISAEAIFTSNTNTAGWERIVLNLEPIDFAPPYQLLFIIDEIDASTKDDFAIDDIKFDDVSNLSVNKEPISGLRYFPNPVKDVLTINANERINTIEIYNLVGQLVLQKEVNNTSFSIDTSEFTLGNYFIKISTDDKLNTVKFIKE